MLDKETAQQFCKELQTDLFTVYREYLQILFLKYFYNQKKSEKVYFKGGTAIRFLLGSFRFSEDLDFTCILSDIDKLIEKTIKVLTKEENIYFKKEKSLSGSYTGRLFQKLPYYNFPLTVRIDISLREKPFKTESNYIKTSFPISPYPLITHLSMEEIMAEKIRAFTIRGKGRDIFDIWYLLTKKVPVDWTLINKKMLFYKKRTDLNALIKKIEKLSEKEIKSDLNRFLPISERKMVNKIKYLTITELNSFQ